MNLETMFIKPLLEGDLESFVASFQNKNVIVNFMKTLLREFFESHGEESKKERSQKSQ